MEVWLLEEDVDLAAVGLGGWEEIGGYLSLEALGNVVLEFDLGIKRVGGGPRLGEGQAWKVGRATS